MKTLLIVYSYHHNNTQKVAEAMATVLDAQIKTPQQVEPQELAGYDLVGFGSGIDSGKHYQPLLDLADRLPKANGSKVFVFSTFGAPISLLSKDAEAYDDAIAKNHRALVEKLQLKGYINVGQFACGGFNTNNFIKYLGGVNKGKPDAHDLKDAEDFAQGLKRGKKP